MSNEEELSSKILSNVDIIADIYKIVKEAGLKTTQSEDVQQFRNNTTIIRANVPNVNRSSANCKYPGKNISNCRSSKSYYITYDVNDMMVVGGSALNIYDYLLRELKERREMKTLEEYIKKRTSDIDIVWWPRMVTNSAGNIIDDEIVTSSSPAINKLVQVFISKLTTHFEEQKESLQTKVRKVIPNSNTDDLTIEIGGDFYEPGKAYHNFKSGTYNVAIKFKIKGREFKICEVLIHDSGASQQFDESGLPITVLQYMNKDPVYCSPVQSSPNHISYHIVNDVNIAIPNILSFVQQQMLAFSNLISNNKDREGRWSFKGFINYKRVEFIKQILQSIKIDDDKNQKDLLEVFKTSNTNYPGFIVTNINTIETRNIDRLYLQIIELCSHYNSSSDPIISELCERAGRKELELWADKKEKELEKLRDKIRFKRQAKNGTTSAIRQQYYDLERRAENYRLVISRMLNSDRLVKQIKEDSLYTNDPVKEILAEEEILNRHAKPVKAVVPKSGPSQDARKDIKVAGPSPAINFGLLPTPAANARVTRLPMGAIGMPAPYPPAQRYTSMPPPQPAQPAPWVTDQFGTTFIWNPHMGRYEVYSRVAPPPPPPPPGYVPHPGYMSHPGYGGPQGPGYGVGRRRGGFMNQLYFEQSSRNNKTYKNRKRNNNTKKNL